MEGKSEYGLKSGNVFSVVKTQQPGQEVKPGKKDPKKTKTKGSCIQWNSTGSCRALAQGRQCQFSHTCNVIVNAGPSGHCGKDHAAKDHQW